MAYVRPQVEVFQQFTTAPATSVAPRAALIVGPHARLFRYAVDDEKVQAALGAYDSLAETTYLWPGRPTGGQVDFSYVKLFADDALLRYYRNVTGSGGLVTPVAGKPNRVRDAVTAFADHGAAYPKSASMLDRGAKVGDTVYVRGTDGADTFDLWTTIRGFVGETVAADVDAATGASTNNGSQSYATSVDELGLANSVTLTADGTAYDGRATGDITETYTVEVTQSSTGSDLTTALLRVTSASGRDNVSSIAPAGAGGFTAIGTRGLLVEFDLNVTASASSAASDNDISPNDLVIGQKWRVRVRQAFTPAVATAAGTYTGTADTTYIAEVTRGGAYLGAEPPQITVTTTTGYDAAAPIDIDAASTAFAAGAYGVTLSFSGTGLAKGDKYYVVVAGAGTGLYQTIVLAHDLPEEIQDAADVDLELYIKTDAELSVADFATNDTQIIVAAAVEVSHADWTDDGVVVDLPLLGGSLFVEYRAWLPTYSDTIYTATAADDIVALLGAVHPDNPLAWGVYMAALNSNGAGVKYTAVLDPDSTDSWLTSIARIKGRIDLYNIVPLTADKIVQDAALATALSESAPAKGAWKACALSVTLADAEPVVSEVTSVDEGVVLAKLADDPDASGTQYTLLSVPAGNANFITNGVAPNYVVRFLYSVDGDGNETYTEFLVDEVLSEDSLRLASANSLAITTAQRVEVWRPLTGATAVAHIVGLIGQHKNRRAIKIANPTVGNAGLEFPGYFAAAAVAGLRSGVVHHQGLTNAPILGLDSPGALVKSLNGDQLDELAAAGGWVLAQAETGEIYTWHALNTDMTDLNSREEMVRVNFDGMSYDFRQVLLPFIGRANVVPTTLTIIENALISVSTQLESTSVGILGPRLLSSQIMYVRPHAVFKDKVVILINLGLPYPLNNEELTLVI